MVSAQEVSAAKKAYQANKADKSLKKAYKALKKQLEAQPAETAATPSKKRKAEAEPEVEAPVKKVKTVTLEDLTAQAKAAKKAYKANKSDKSLKAAYKALQKQVEEFVAPAAEEETTEKVEEEAAAPAEDSFLNGFKKNDDAPAKPAMGNTDHEGNAPNEKVFAGNLPWSVDEDAMKEFFKDCGTIVECKWVEDRETGRFKGCGFLTFSSLEESAKAIALNDSDCGGRPIRLNYAKNKANFGANKNNGSARASKPLSERPDNCTTVFCGNLSFDIDDDAMRKFCEEAGCAEVAGIRWLTDRETGDFKGCGFVEFYESDSVDKFVLKNGENLMGRPIRVDYSKPRERN